MPERFDTVCCACFALPACTANAKRVYIAVAALGNTAVCHHFVARAVDRNSHCCSELCDGSRTDRDACALWTERNRPSGVYS